MTKKSPIIMNFISIYAKPHYLIFIFTDYVKIKNCIQKIFGADCLRKICLVPKHSLNISAPFMRNFKCSSLFPKTDISVGVTLLIQNTELKLFMPKGSIISACLQKFAFISEIFNSLSITYVYRDNSVNVFAAINKNRLI
jgi:hypothetical protein